MCVYVRARQNCWEHVIKFGSGIICNVSRSKVLDRLGQASYSRARFWQLARNIRRNDRSIDASVALVVNLDLALNKTKHTICMYIVRISRLSTDFIHPYSLKRNVYTWRVVSFQELRNSRIKDYSPSLLFFHRAGSLSMKRHVPTMLAVFAAFNERNARNKIH